MERQGIEFAFLESWDGWDEVSAFALQFTDVVLRADVAERVPFKVVCVVVDSSTSIVSFYGEEEEDFIEFEMNVTLGKEIKTDG